ncbi:MAG TPA: diaminopimelate epimerase [Polyangiaceae bacterium]|nr:diaminopimelate epimerase [Polyangiaceae bacterium]HMR76073.1 diaminopimelate epimerase [Polyangiaceae bacterium]
MRVEFEKFEGLGNDFIVVETDVATLHPHVPALCDRHFGIGADGVLFVSRPHSGAARATMTVINADGSRPEMCGNGLRCVALFLARKDAAADISYLVDTEAGALSCEVTRETPNQAQVRTCLGQGQPQPDHVWQHAGRSFEFQRVSMGNPHAILFEAMPSIAEIDEWGPLVSACFEAGSNVEFAFPRGEQGFDLIVWERGVGRTLACGTGAAATGVAAVRTGRAQYDEPIAMHLPGGALEISVSRPLEVTARGPARHVFSGSVEVP